MKFEYRYYGETTATHTDKASAVSFAPDTLRAPAYFVGQLRQTLAFREAMGALHQVVVSDLRVRGRDATAYKAWLEANESALLARYMAEAQDLKAQAASLHKELSTVRASKQSVLRPFYDARQKYFNWLYNANRDLWYVLDPVITIHPDRVLFEAFSQDESAYCSVSVSRNLFDHIGETACGTTNIDYSAALADEFQRLRDYKTTTLAIDPSGFAVTTADDPAFKEEKIDVPDTWVRGFLQVTSAMTLPATAITLHPMDLHNLCAVLRQKKERVGPRSIRFELTPGQPVKLVLEPWGIEIICRRTPYAGATAQTVRLWGRRRLLVLERLIAVAESVTVYLSSNGMPSFWVVALPEIVVTLGLSGWTSNDWSQAGRFDLLGPRHHVAEDSKQRVFAALGRHWLASADQLARDTGLDRPTVEAALTLWVQAGRVVYDLPRQCYALRELSREPLPLETLRFQSAEEDAAAKLVQAGKAKLGAVTRNDKGQLSISGAVTEGKNQYAPQLTLDGDERMIAGVCSCNFYQQNKLRKGPCPHLLALRLVAQPWLNDQRSDRRSEQNSQQRAAEASPS